MTKVNKIYSFNKSKIFLLLLNIFLISSCIINKPLIQEVSVGKYTVPDTINYEIKNASVIDKTLILEIEYFGTKQDKFNLHFSGNFKKSYPPIANIYLSHEINNNEKIRKHNAILSYNLSKLEYPNTDETVIALKYYENKLIYKHTK